MTPRDVMAETGRCVGTVLGALMPGVAAPARTQLRDVATRASAWATTLTSAQATLRGGVSARHLRRAFEGLEVFDVEGAVNDVLWQQAKSRLPSRCIVALDWHLIPYHGKPERDESELRRCKAIAGTTWFHGYATVNVVMHGKRYTVAVTFVRKGETAATTLERILDGVMKRGLRIHRLLADKGFCTKACIEALRQRSVSFVIPLALRGRAARALQQGRGAYATTHVMAGLEIPVAIIVRRNGAKYHRRKPGNQYFPYLYDGFDASPKAVDKLYRKRGGIETSYRLSNEARARTTTRRPATRLLLFSIALILQNAWITTTWQLSQPTRGRQGRKHPPGFFPFRHFLHMLAAAIEHVRHLVLNVTQISGGK